MLYPATVVPNPTTVVPAKAGIHRKAGWMRSAWRCLRGALIKGLCLADPWVPAFAGTTWEKKTLEKP
jgi:hypothetical protein